jgi:hypothetical protein
MVRARRHRGKSRAAPAHRPRRLARRSPQAGSRHRKHVAGKWRGILAAPRSARSRRKRSRERPWAARLAQARRWAARGYRIDQIRCSATWGSLVMGDGLLADLRIMNWHASRSETSSSPIVPGIANPPQKSGLTGRSGRERLGKSGRPRKAVQRPIAGLLRLTLRGSSMARTDLSRDFKAEFDLASGVTGRFTRCEEPRAPS